MKDRKVFSTGKLEGLQIDENLKRAFPGLRVEELEFHHLAIRKTERRPEEFKRQKQKEIREKVRSLDEIKSVSIFRAYRDFYWKVGIDPTKTRPAGEALVRRILGGRDLPTINTLVDSYNIASAESFLAIAAFDLSSISKDLLLMRTAIEGESFHGIGMVSAIKLTGVEIVIEDTANRNLIAVYPYRDSDSSKVTERSAEVLMMMCGVPGISDNDLDYASTLTKRYVEKFCEFSSKDV